jgi:hypothetical protein
MLNTQAMEAVVHLRLNLAVALIHYSAFDMIRGQQAVSGFEDFAMTLADVHLVAYAAAYDASGAQVEAAVASPKRWKPRSRPVGSTSSPSRSTISRTSAYLSTSCGSPPPREG